MLRQKMLWGVFAALVAGMLVLGACNSQKPTSQADDQTITSEIQTQLFQDSVLKTRDLRVTSQDGAVVMVGNVGTELEKAAALRIAQKTAGVRQVIDQITVSSGAAAAPAAVEQASTAEAQPSRSSEPAPAARSARRERAGTHPAASMAPAAPAESPAPRPMANAAATTETTPPAAPPAPQPEPITIPAGTVLTVRTIDAVDSTTNHAGDEFDATIDAPVAVGERVIIPRNADARLRLVQAKGAGRMTGRSELQIELIGVTVNGVSYPLETAVYTQAGASRGKRTAATVGGGAALGALIGAIAGHGKGAAIGAAVGAGGGTVVQAATKGEVVKIPSETKLDFTLRTPLTITK